MENEDREFYARGLAFLWRKKRSAELVLAPKSKEALIHSLPSRSQVHPTQEHENVGTRQRTFKPSHMNLHPKEIHSTQSNYIRLYYHTHTMRLSCSQDPCSSLRPARLPPNHDRPADKVHADSPRERGEREDEQSKSNAQRRAVNVGPPARTNFWI